MQFRFLKLQLTCRSKAILSALRDAGQHIAVLRPSKRKTTSSERPNSCLFLYLTKEGAMENYFGQVQGSLNLRSVARQGKGEKDTGQFYLSVYHVLSVSLWWERKKEERGIRNDQSKVKSQDEITTNAELRGNTGRQERKKPSEQNWGIVCSLLVAIAYEEISGFRMSLFSWWKYPREVSVRSRYPRQAK